MYGRCCRPWSSSWRRSSLHSFIHSSSSAVVVCRRAHLHRAIVQSREISRVSPELRNEPMTNHRERKIPSHSVRFQSHSVCCSSSQQQQQQKRAAIFLINFIFGEIRTKTPIDPSNPSIVPPPPWRTAVATPAHRTPQN